MRFLIACHRHHHQPLSVSFPLSLSLSIHHRVLSTATKGGRIIYDADSHVVRMYVSVAFFLKTPFLGSLAIIGGEGMRRDGWRLVLSVAKTRHVHGCVRAYLREIE